MLVDVQTILRVCGLGTFLQIGGGEATLVFELLKRGANAYGLENSATLIQQFIQRAPNHFVQSTVHTYPFKPREFDTIIIGDELFSLNSDELLAVLQTLVRATRHALVFYIPPTSVGKMSSFLQNSRTYWEELIFKAGFRRHARAFLATHYNDLEHEKIANLHFFEPVPLTALEKYPITWVKTQKNPDRLRITSPAAEEEIAKHMLAATHIRANDTVVILNSGSGYGSRILSTCSRAKKIIGITTDSNELNYALENFAAFDPALSYYVSDLTHLNCLDDFSADIVIAFDLLQFQENHDDLLCKEIQRILKPDGRVFGTTAHPTYPLQQDSWQKISSLLNQYFIVDARWTHFAEQNKRSIAPLALNKPVNYLVTWWMFSACADPLKINHLPPYTNAYHPDIKTPPAALIDFAKYYDNPWLYRLMVQLGERLMDRDVLVAYCIRVIQQTRVGSPDQGAALCVAAYQLLESGYITLEGVKYIITATDSFEKAYDANNPHAFRWCLSLHYVKARLYLAIGHRVEALHEFLQCIAMDPIKLSPLLATKTISAHMYAGLIYMLDNQAEEAKKHFLAGSMIPQTALRGDWKNIIDSLEDPLPFGLSEAAEVLDIASQCARALKALDKRNTAPGFFWDCINLKRFGLVEWNKSLENENRKLREKNNS